MSLWKKLFGEARQSAFGADKHATQPFTPANPQGSGERELIQGDIIDALQAGTVGTVVNLYLACHDRSERSTELRQKILSTAYKEMVPLCPGLMVDRSRIVVDKADNNHFIVMSVRFLHPSDAPAFQEACSRILRRHGFEA